VRRKRIGPSPSCLPRRYDGPPNDAGKSFIILAPTAADARTCSALVTVPTPTGLPASAAR